MWSDLVHSGLKEYELQYTTTLDFFISSEKEISTKSEFEISQ